MFASDVASSCRGSECCFVVGLKDVALALPTAYAVRRCVGARRGTVLSARRTMSSHPDWPEQGPPPRHFKQLPFHWNRLPGVASPGWGGQWAHGHHGYPRKARWAPSGWDPADVSCKTVCGSNDEAFKNRAGHRTGLCDTWRVCQAAVFLAAQFSGSSSMGAGQHV